MVGVSSSLITIVFVEAYETMRRNRKRLTGKLLVEAVLPSGYPFSNKIDLKMDKRMQHGLLISEEEQEVLTICS